MMDIELRKKSLPFVASAVVIILDQLTKWIVVRNIVPYTAAWSSGEGEFLRIIHVKNRAVAFSLGDSLPDEIRLLLFILLPLVIITAIVVYMLKSDEFTRLQRWSAALMVGGGIGNLIDRVFRSSGVVDFIDVRFYGLFGLQRWPTFNIADSSVVIGGILLIASLIFSQRSTHHE